MKPTLSAWQDIGSGVRVRKTVGAGIADTQIACIARECGWTVYDVTTDTLEKPPIAVGMATGPAALSAADEVARGFGYVLDTILLDYWGVAPADLSGIRVAWRGSATETSKGLFRRWYLAEMASAWMFYIANEDTDTIHWDRMCRKNAQLKDTAWIAWGVTAGKLTETQPHAIAQEAARRFFAGVPSWQAPFDFGRVVPVHVYVPDREETP